MTQFFLNDASLHGQFSTLADLIDSLLQIFNMRSVLNRSGYRLEVNRLLAARQAIDNQTFREVIGRDNNRERKRSILIWIDRDGPFWDDPLNHSLEEYFECENYLVTETALAEACSLAELSLSVSVLSLSPSNFLQNPLHVVWRARKDGDRSWPIQNFISELPLAEYLQSISKPLNSWEELLDWVNSNCPSLLLSPAIPSQLPTSFYSNVAQRAQVLLLALNEINTAIQNNDVERFEELRHLWFEGKNARLTDSSDSEKEEFKKKLTFTNPVTGQDILCGWHAKIKTPQYRIHFEWPKHSPDDALFIAYIGPKLTKR